MGDGGVGDGGVGDGGVGDGGAGAGGNGGYGAGVESVRFFLLKQCEPTVVSFCPHSVL